MLKLSCTQPNTHKSPLDMSVTTEMSFTISLEPTADAGSFFRYRNSPGELQRRHIVDRSTTSDHTLQGDLSSVIHGRYKPGGDPATLITVVFRFMSSRYPRKFRHATITFDFSDPRSRQATDIEVRAISPENYQALNPSMVREDSKLSLAASAQIGGPTLPDSTGGKVAWASSSSRSVEKADQGSLVGSMKTVGRTHGPKNAVIWQITENRAQRDGIPPVFRAAILLKRDHFQIFQVLVKVKASVDILHSIKSAAQAVFGDTTIDPVYFDPGRPPMGEIPNGLDVDNLSAFPLDAFVSHVATPTIYTMAGVVCLLSFGFRADQSLTLMAQEVWGGRAGGGVREG